MGKVTARRGRDRIQRDERDDTSRSGAELAACREGCRDALPLAPRIPSRWVESDTLPPIRSLHGEAVRAASGKREMARESLRCEADAPRRWSGSQFDLRFGVP